MKKRILSFLLALAMVIGMTVPAVYAEEQAQPLLQPSDLIQRGNQIAAAANAMGELENGQEALCPVCNETVVWKALNKATNWVNDKKNATHLFVPEDMALSDLSSSAGGAAILSATDVCLYLNGKILEVTDAAPISIQGGVCNIFGQGTVKGCPKSGISATISIYYDAVANLYGGTYTKSENSHSEAPVFLQPNKHAGTCNMYGTAKIDGGDILTDANPGCVLINNSESDFNMYGGTITGGNSVGYGGNVRVSNGQFNMYAGTISNGKITAESVAVTGGNVYVNTNGRFEMFGGELTNTNKTNYGANISTVGECYIRGGEITDGKSAWRGGNVYVAGGKFEMTGGMVSGGTTTNGGNFYVAKENSHAIFAGGTISNGDIYMENTLTLQGNPVIEKLTVPADKTFTVGQMTAGASVGVNGSGILSTNGDLQAAAQYFYGTKATGDTLIPTTAEGKLSYSPANLGITANNAEAWCAACGEVKTWSWCIFNNTATQATSHAPTSASTAGGHYYLGGDKNITALNTTAFSVTADSCFHFNGKNINMSADQWVFSVTGGNLNILGKGTVTVSAKTGTTSAAININNGSVVNLFGGSFVKAGTVKTTPLLMMDGNNHGTYNMYRGVELVGNSSTAMTSVAACVWLANPKGEFNMYGGTIRDGKGNFGANVVIGNKNQANGGTFRLYGGTITGGVSTGNGGNVFMTSGTLVLAGGSITDGTGVKGNNIYVGENATITVEQSFDGTASVRYPSDITYSDLAVVPGTSTGFYTGSLTLEGMEGNVGIYGIDGQLKVCTHDWNEATCIAAKTCKICGATEGEKLHHYYVRAVEELHLVSAATCQTAAKYNWSCAGCDEELDKVFNNGELLSHTYDQQVVVDAALKTPADCDSEAVYYLSCTCGAISKNAEEVFTSGGVAAHVWEAKAAVNATCTADGNIAYYDCENCELLAVKNGDAYVITAWDDIKTQDPDNHDLAEAWTDGKKACSRCDYVEECEHTETELDKSTMKEATCTTKGYTGDTKCTECGVVTVKGHDTDMAPHAGWWFVDQIVTSWEHVSCGTGKETTDPVVDVAIFYYCEGCDQEFYSDFVEAVCHIEPASCEATGIHTHIADCSKLSVEGIDPANFEKNTMYEWEGWDDESQTYTQSWVLPSLGHDYKVTYTNDGETHTKVETCANDAAHKVETSNLAHVYDQDGDKCVCGAAKPQAEETDQAQINGQKYETLQAALTAAAQSETPVVIDLLKDTEVGMTTVADGVTLNLNGKTLTVAEGAYVIACFETSFITDTEGTGRIVVDIDHLLLLQNNGQLPVQTETGIMFVDAALKGNWSTKDDCFKFWFDEETTDAALIEQLKKGSKASELKIQVELSYNNGLNKMSYVYDDAVLAQYLAMWDQNACLTIAVQNVGSISDLTFTAKVVFADGTEAEVNVLGAAVEYGASAVS